MADRVAEVIVWRRAALTAELPPDSRRVVELDDRRVLLLNVGGELFAFEAVCPHQAYPLDDAYVYDGCLECPFHGYRYRLATGENEYPACDYPPHLPYLKAGLKPLMRFQVRLEDEEVWVAAEGGAIRSE
jgi:nitrite reductase/ring-hydroxylating ferredoxin subunit